MNKTAIKQAVYMLKKEYSVRFKYRVWTSVPDMSKGVISNTINIYNIVGLKVPTRVKTTFFYDVGYLRANSNFTYGGHNETPKTSLIILDNDVPLNCKCMLDKSVGDLTDLNRDIIIGSVRYDISEVEDYQGVAKVFSLVASKNSKTFDEIDVKVIEHNPVGDDYGHT
jgi:hypothetical protein